MIELLSDPQAWIAFLTLTVLELVLGIDNIIFISILVDKLPPKQRETARRVGLFLAMFMRVGLLLVLPPFIGHYASRGMEGGVRYVKGKWIHARARHTPLIRKREIHGERAPALGAFNGPYRLPSGALGLI